MTDHRQGKHRDEEKQQRSTESVSSTGTVLEEQQLQPGTAGTYGEADADAVNVEAAIEEYNEIKRELSRISRVSSASNKTESKMEQGLAADQELFDLDDYLRGISQEERENGKTPKSLGLIWRDLTVEGLGADAHTIPTVFSFIYHSLQVWKRFGIGLNGSSEKTILRNLTGFCKPGEMVLVLGRPGAGCTTLLKVLSNIRGSYTNIDGVVSYGGIDHETFAKHYRGQVVYNEEEDQHYPTLTLKQTLQFALRTKTPGNRLPEESKTDFVNKILYMLGNMLGLTKQMNTMVGNAFIRGLSGGERKRLSIAEVMTTQSSINLWDCSTRGLDAASALDYVRSLRIMTDVLNKTTVATLYQASDSIFNLFDRVLVLDEGRCIYFGPTSKAKAYFEDLGFHCPLRKSTPDFLTGLCNPLEREFKPGFEDSAPKYAKEFEEWYIQSDIHEKMMAELNLYEEAIARENPAETFKAAVREEHQKHASKKHPYTASFFQQVKALTIRQYHLLIKDQTALISRYGTILIQALITGSCFYNLPLDGAGGFSRSGAIMFAMLFNAFVSNTELVNFLMGRPVLEKHKHFAMYRPSSYYIAQVIMDVPYAVVQVFLFSIIGYFMIGLKMAPGNFFAFCLNIFFINMMMNGYFRFFGAITSSFFVATQVSGVLFVTMVTYLGYVIDYNSMHPWLSWIFWINPMAYGFKALLINEMSGQIYSCDGQGNAIPYGPGYDDWRYKTCVMKGGKPGQNFVLGDDYLRAALSYEPNHEWAPDFVVVVGFFILFTVATALAMEFSAANRVGSLTKLYLLGKAPKPRTVQEENERRKKQQKITEKMDTIATGTTFTWHHVNYSVPFKGGPLQLLNDVSGIVRPGHLTALMGSSGAGKTTLLDVLARRKTIGKVEGRVYLNNEALMNDFERITGYCEQMDIHQPAVTVREALRFSAYLRQEASVSKKEKDDYVEQIIQLLEMEDIADAQIGQVEHGVGISVEERKRLTIGMELVGKPKLLFLDEPTSGLDAQSSYNIVRFIRKLADAGWPVLCTIHQPSAILFEHFDHLLLLVRGGKTAYYGEIGPDAKTMIDYFESNGGPKCGADTNPAEYILEVVGAGTSGKAGASKRDWSQVWQQSPQAKALEDELERIHQAANKSPTRKASTYATPFWTQFHLVMKRMTIAYWRSPDYNVGRFVTIMFTSLLFGFTYWKMSLTSADMQNRMFALFTTFIMAYIIIVLAQPRFMTERMYFRREHAQRYYGWAPFAISAVLVEIPYVLVYCALFMAGFYWTAGLVNTSETAGYFYLIFIFFVLWAVTLGFVIAAASESPTMAAVLIPIFVSTLVLFAGCFQPPSEMPYFWRSWMYWIDPFHYFIEGLVVNEMANLPVVCKGLDLVKVTPPPGQTCGEYMANFFSYGAPGYIANPNATDVCGYCPYSSGEQYYTLNFGFDAANKWRNLGIIISFFAFNVLVFLAFCYWKRKERR